MPRPHEDLQRHTTVDHRSGGMPIAISPGAWFAIDIAHVAADRANAGISTYETLIEKARTSSTNAHAAVIFRSGNHRRVISLVELDGHDGFRHIAAAWDDHHLFAQRHAVAESSALTLYRVAASSGDAFVDPESSDAYAFENIARAPERLHATLALIAAAPGFLGATLFGRDDATASAILYRFAHIADIEAFRATLAAQDILGPIGASDEKLYAVHPVKTFVSGRT